MGATFGSVARTLGTYLNDKPPIRQPILQGLAQLVLTQRAQKEATTSAAGKARITRPLRDGRRLLRAVTRFLRDWYATGTRLVRDWSATGTRLLHDCFALVTRLLQVSIELTADAKQALE